MADISSSSWSTTDANNNQDSPNGWNSNTTQSQTIAIMQANMGAVKRLWERQGAALTSTGSANNYIITPTNNAYPTALVKGDIIGFLASFGNTSGATVSYNGITPIPIKKQSSTGPTPLTGNEIKTGQLVILGYDGSALQMISNLSDSSSASGTVTSVGMTGDGTVFNSTVTGSPIASSGTLAPTLKTQTAHFALLGPTTGTAAPSFRAIALADLPAQTGSGSIVLATSPTISNPTITGTLAIAAIAPTTGIQGVTNGGNAGAGYVGEYVSAQVAIGSAVGLTTNVTSDMTSISLTAGDWDVFGMVYFRGDVGTTVTNAIAGISLTSALFPSALDAQSLLSGNNEALYAGGNTFSLNVGPTRVSISTTTTVYVVAQSGFASGNSSVFGLVRARRVR